MRVRGSITGRAAVGYYREASGLMAKAVEALGVADGGEVLSALGKLQARALSLEAEVKAFVSEAAKDVVQSLADRASSRDGMSVVAEVVDARDMDHLLSLVDQVRNRVQPGVVALGADLRGKATLVVSVSPEVSGVDAGRVVSSSAREFGGGGGGTARLGRGGGGDPAKLEAALEAARRAILESLGA